jgi:hypothetical protein
MVSHATGVDPAFLRYRRANRSATWDSSSPIPPPGSKVLLCEDIAGVGHTLQDCLSFLQRRGLKVKILTLGFDDLSSIRPDYGIDGRGYVLRFPWERQARTSAYREQWNKTGGGRTGQMTQDHMTCTPLISTAFCSRTFRTSATLPTCIRHCTHATTLSLSSSCPPLDQVTAIVTGRPEMDRVRTQAWLSRHGHGETLMIMRDPRLYNDTPEQVASHKARATLQLGCTHFVESDPVQAILIAQHAPLLRVIWWEAQSRLGWLIGAAAWRSV